MTLKFGLASKIYLSICLILVFNSCEKKVDVTQTNSTLTNLNNLTKASSIGIGSGSTYFNLGDTRDLITPFDFYSSGTANQLVCYRPGTGAIYIMTNNAPLTGAPNFVAAFQSGAGLGTGTNNYNLGDSRDRIVPYDADGTGKLNYLICYRPGASAFWIFKNTLGTFTPILKSSIGIGSSPNNYNLGDSRDVIVPFDFYSTGHSSQLLCYRPGTGTCWVMNNTAAVGATPNFVPVYQTSSGIGTPPNFIFNLGDNRDIILPYDFTGIGHKDGIICYRPGTGSVYDYTHTVANSFAVYFVSNVGIYNDQVPPHNFKYDFGSNTDRIAPYDYYSNGRTDGIVCYRPGAGACWIFTNYTTDGEGDVVYQHSNGLGSGSTFFDLMDVNDKIFAYDFAATGKIDHLVVYRPGSGAIWIFNNALAKIY